MPEQKHDYSKHSGKSGDDQVIGCPLEHPVWPCFAHSQPANATLTTGDNGDGEPISRCAIAIPASPDP